ncbi:MAG: 50S ribosomal protein L28 [Chloroflexota bacterium]|nr:50S ribosomal protein L28 [Chloroflexota bacterium]
MAKCEICNKSGQFGHNVSHSKRATNRRWLPNVQSTRLQMNGQTKRVKLCTRCLRTYHKVQT